MKTKLLMVMMMVFCGLVFLGGFGDALAETFPSKPVVLVSSFGPGGTTDVAMRALGSVFYTYFGQPAIVVNKVGGAGIVAGDFVVKQKPDGYTVANLVPSGAVPEVYTYFRKATYTSDDLKPLCLMNLWPFGLYVKGDSQFKSLNDIIAYAKKNPGKLTYAHNGRGHSYHLLMELVKDKNGIKTGDVTFGSGADVAMQVLGQHVDFGLSATAGTVDSLIKAGKLRLLAVHHSERLSMYPDVPTFEELGYKFRLHYGALFVNKNTPEDIAQKLREGLKKCFDDKSFKSIMNQMGFIIRYEGPEYVQNLMASEKEVVGPLLKKLGFVKQ
jgi:tripartite-type tricarboxylate transporter receptor subunit TctC